MGVPRDQTKIKNKAATKKRLTVLPIRTGNDKKKKTQKSGQTGNERKK
jgi:hypothetical protein